MIKTISIVIRKEIQSVMDDPGSLVFKIVLLFILIIVNAFFAMSEIAIISLNDNMIDKLAEEGHKKAKKVKKLTDNPSNFLSTIQIGVTLAGFLTSASAATNFATMLTNAIESLGTGIPTSVIKGVSVVLITILLSGIRVLTGLFNIAIGKSTSGVWLDAAYNLAVNAVTFALALQLRREYKRGAPGAGAQPAQGD